MVAAAPSPIGPFRPRASSHLSPAGLGRRRGQSRDRSRRVQALPRSVIRRARGSRPARAEAQTLRAIPDGPHHRDDLLNARRIRRIAQTLVPWRTPGMESRHRRRRSATPSSVQQHRLHHTLLGSKDNPAIVLWVPHGHNGQPRRRDHAIAAARRTLRSGSKRKRAVFVRPIANRDRTGESGAIASVALRSPRRGRVARRSPSIAIVGRRLLGRFLLGGRGSPPRPGSGAIRTTGMSPLCHGCG